MSLVKELLRTIELHTPAISENLTLLVTLLKRVQAPGEKNKLPVIQQSSMPTFSCLEMLGDFLLPRYTSGDSTK